jgi:hypothetical protein
VPNSVAIAVRDAVVAAVSNYWQPAGNDSVQAAYDVDFDSLKLLAGRKVLVACDPQAMRQSSTATRNDDAYDYPIYVAIAEPYTAAGNPTAAWMDARVEFYEELFKLLGESRLSGATGVLTGEAANCYAVETDPVVVWDADEFRENKLYFGLMVVTYRAHEGEES